MNPGTEQFSPERRAAVPVETLPYTQRLQGSEIGTASCRARV